MNKSVLLLLSATFFMVKGSVAQSFTPGNIVVFSAAASANNTSAELIELDTLTASQVYPGVGAHAIPADSIRFSGSATSTGYLSNSDDSTLILFTGGYTSNTAVNINTILPRAVGSFDNGGNFVVKTSYTGVSGDQTRGATTVNNVNFYIGDQGGIHSNGTISPSPSGNFRSVKSFGGQVYVFRASATLAPVATVTAPVGGTVTSLPGLPLGTSTKTDFYLISSGASGSVFDVLYVLEATSATVGVISKFSLVSGTWTANGTYNTTFGGFGLTARPHVSGGAFLFVTTGTGATTNNSVIRLTDLAGYNMPININTASNVILYTGTGGKIVKGVAFAPTLCKAPVYSVSTNDPICTGDTLVFAVVLSQGTQPLTYAWSGAGTINTPTMSSTEIYNATSTLYSVTVSNACASVMNSGTPTVNSLPSVTANASSTVTCANDLVTFTGSGAVSYSWNNGVTDGVAYSTTGTMYYVVTGTDGNGCMNTDSIMVTVNSLPTVTANSSSTSICTEDMVTLTGSGAVSYSWNNGVTDGMAFSPTGTMYYTVIGTDVNGCMNIDSIMVIVNPLPTPVISLSGSDLMTGTYSTIQWYLNGTSISGANSSTYTPTANGAYTVIVSDSNGCSDTSAVFNFTMLNINQNQASSYSVYPNPFNNGINFQCSVGNLVEVEVMSALGQRVYHNAKFNGGFVDLSSLESGIYFLSITDKNTKTQFQIIKKPE